MIEWGLFLVIGIFAGTSAGLFGLGGGIIVVPALVMVYQTQAMNDAVMMHVAVGTSLMTIMITSLASAYSHYRYKYINWQIFLLLTPALLIGAFLGSYLAISISGSVLQQCFSVFLIASALKIWLPISSFSSLLLLKRRFITLFGIVAGGVSALVGIGGGSLIVPYLVTAKQPIKQAIGTSAACGFPIALAGVIGFISLDNDSVVSTRVWQTGFIDWQAFLGIISSSIIFARIGASLAKQLPVMLLQRIFSLVLIMIGLKMWFETL